MATHSSILTWKISWTREPGGLQSMGSQRVGHDLATEYTIASYKRIPCSWIKSTRKLFLYREPMAVKGTKTNVDRMCWTMLVCHWWEWKTVQLLWKIVWQVFKRLNKNSKKEQQQQKVEHTFNIQPSNSTPRYRTTRS